MNQQHTPHRPLYWLGGILGSQVYGFSYWGLGGVVEEKTRQRQLEKLWLGTRVWLGSPLLPLSAAAAQCVLALGQECATPTDLLSSLSPVLSDS